MRAAERLLYRILHDRRTTRAPPHQIVGVVGVQVYNSNNDDQSLRASTAHAGCPEGGVAAACAQCSHTPEGRPLYRLAAAPPADSASIACRGPASRAASLPCSP